MPFQRVRVPPTEESSHCCSHIRQRDLSRWKPGSKSPRRPGSRFDPYRGASNLTGRSKSEPVKPRKRAPREADCGNFGSAEPLRSRRRPCRHRALEYIDVELPGVIEGGMPGRNVQRKPGTARGSPRRSRTAKASRISHHAVKSRCARERDGWGRLSDDGPGHYNPDLSEGPWGGGLPTLQAVHDRVLR